MITISIIIPVFNEENTILEILKKVKKQKFDQVNFEVIVVNDGSIDNTFQILKDHKKYYDKLINRKKSGGKGSAILDGLKIAKGKFLLFQDADLEYDPHDYKKLIIPVQKFNADLVIGSRLKGSEITRTSYFWNKLGNILITFLFNILYNTTFTDIYSCYLLIKKNKLNLDKIKTKGWEQQAEILSQVVLNSNLHYEVPINYYGRTYEEGKKIRPFHIFKVIFTIIYKRVF